jgi:glycosyltransferase involved in cell wall biosynthesis
MRIVFLSRNPFGVQGTPGTYKLVTAFSKFVNVKILASQNNFTNADIVFNLSSDFPIVNIDYGKPEEMERMVSEVVSFKPSLLYYCSGTLWKASKAQALLKIKEMLPEVKVVLDIKSPVLEKDKYKAALFRKTSSDYQHLLDLVFSRTQEDVAEWFEQLDAPVVLYPLGVPLDQFRFKQHDGPKVFSRRFVYVGAIHHRRQIDKLIFFLKQFSAQMRENFQLDMYGSGPYVDALSNILRQENLDEVVTIKGSVNQDKLYELFLQYDAGLGWVPYQSYDFAPSLKSYEYIAAGLVPLLSDTLAHHRLFESGFNIQLFSNEAESFVQSVHKVQFEGFDTVALARNRDIIRDHDWDNVVAKYLYPELEALVSSRFTPTFSDNVSECLQAGKDLAKALENHNVVKGQRILFIFGCNNILDYTLPVAISGLNGLGYELAACHFVSESMPEFTFDFFGAANFPMSGLENVSRAISTALQKFSPHLAVIFYTGYECISLMQHLLDKGIPVIVSERVRAERMLRINWSHPLNISVAKAAWWRELLLANATSIHLQNSIFLSDIPDFLHSRVHVFSDDITFAKVYGGQSVYKTIARKWSDLIAHATSTYRQSSQSVPCESRELSLHFQRMKYLLMENGIIREH